MDYVLDIQGFQCPKDIFICKELAYTPLCIDSIPQAVFFEPPYHWLKLPTEYRRVNRWIETHHHGMLWGSGVLPYKILPCVLRNLKNCRNIYVKGMDKKQWLQKIVPEKKILDLETEMRCPPLNELTLKNKTFCAFHSQSYVNLTCAITNVKKLSEWILERQKQAQSEGVDTVERFICDCNLYKNSSMYFKTAMSTTEHKDYRQSVLYSMYN